MKHDLALSQAPEGTVSSSHTGPELHTGTTSKKTNRATARSKNGGLVESTEAAAIAGKGINEFLRLARAGVIPGLKSGRVWRFRRSDIEAWVDQEIALQTQARRVQ